MEFRLLGPLEVVEHDRVFALGRGRQRCLFAVLLLHANEVVSTHRLIDALWGERPPLTAAKSIQVYVSRLRKELGEGRLVTVAPGYVLRVDASELDLARFERLLGAARSADPQRAAQKLRGALALWRGPALAGRRGELLDRGVAARTAVFSSPAPGEDVVRLASQQDVDLLLMDVTGSPLDREAGVVLERAPCDVAMLVAAGGSLRPGPVVVPFGAAEHDWAGLELGAWVARATGAPLRLISAASDRQQDGRDASRLLADASLIVQRTAGVVAEPLLASPVREGVIALARGAGLLVVGISERWRQEGLGRVRMKIVETPPAPTVLGRRGPRPGGLAPADTRTRFRWSLTAMTR